MTSRTMQLVFLFSFAIMGRLLLPALTAADGPQDNRVDDVRRIPKLGIEVPPADQKTLEDGLAQLAAAIQKLEENPKVAALLPDVLIFHRAVDQALRYQEFFDAKELPVAKKLLETGQQRAAQLLAGKPEWTRQTGLVVKGYRSKIDGSIQPYGLVIPESYKFDDQKLVRLDLWFHGRGETLSELSFLQQRMTQKGEFTPTDTIVLHPYGRYCNANKLAGEIDTFEALDSARQFYQIDPERIAVRGFSMGGAACWQFAVHYPGKWFAANPGAGFAESPDFLKVFQNETLQPSWYEQRLWRMYDCTGYAANLAFLPTVAYSGDMDKQKQAADIMEQALQKEGLTLRHIIGPMTAHKIHPDSKVELDRILSEWERSSPTERIKPLPAKGDWETIDQFVTFTLRYPESRMITILGLEEHWQPARVALHRSKSTGDLWVTTSNVTSFALKPWSGDPSTAVAKVVAVNDQKLPPNPPLTLKGLPQFEVRKDKVQASLGDRRPGPSKTLRKVTGLQGPIDDAFMDSFLIVKPTGQGASPDVEKWVAAELDHAIEHWRRHFRGDARVKLDREVTAEDMSRHHLILFGDYQSNAVIAKLYRDLPVTWSPDDRQVSAGSNRFDGAHHAVIAVYPNPLAKQRYIVLNSGFTFREYDYLNNARQTPKLPDWAIVDVRTPPNSRFPGKIVAADFFNEEWQLKPVMATQP